MPAFGFGSAVSVTGLHVRPPSFDHVSKMRCERVRPIACSLPPGCTRMLGWMASIGSPADDAGGCTIVHVLPPSVDRSKWIRHALGVSGDSVLDGLRIAPSSSRTGLFLIGPRIPSGSRRGSLHVRPPSRDVRAIPHHPLGRGPTL